MPIDAKRAQAIFAAAIELTDASERAALLDRECGGDADLRRRVEILLAAHDDSAGLPAADPHGTGAFAPGGISIDLAPGTVFAGRYKIREKLGEGGMGTVYVADQTEPVQRRIALKIIKTDLASDRLLARFEQERQALALMDHPNIAKVLDAGVADSTPYFAMELIKGVPITKYCDEAKLTPKQRLELFIPVCQAVQHAHQKGIIHRDLKPSNILIGLYDGRAVPKVIDFGVAKATGAKLTDQSVYTEVGSLIGTLEYMSPEQAELNNLDIDTRSDIYALGVVLYELLAGTVPHSRKELKSAGFAEMLRIIKEVEPPKPSTRLSGSGSLPSIAASRHTEPKKLTALMRNDLDWIVMKALEKDRSRRYETANGFAMDIQRYLADEPLLAGPPSAGYRLRKFVKRNKAQVIAAGLVLLALVVGIAGTTFGLIRADTARIAESKQRRIAEEKEREALDEKTKAEAAQQQAMEALRATTDDVVQKLIGAKLALGPAEKEFIQSALNRYQAFANEHGDNELSRQLRAEGVFRVAVLRDRFGDRDAALAGFREAVVLIEKLVSDFPTTSRHRQNLGIVFNDLGELFYRLGKPLEAESAHRQALTIEEKLVADFPDQSQYRCALAVSHSNLANVLGRLGSFVDAEAAYRRALAIQERLGAEFPGRGEFRQYEAATCNNLGAFLLALGNSVEAESLTRRAAALRGELAAKFPDDLQARQDFALGQFSLASLLDTLGKHEEAESVYGKAVEILTELTKANPSVLQYRIELAKCYQGLGTLYFNLARRPDAELAYRRVLEICDKLPGEFAETPTNRQVIAHGRFNLARLLSNSSDQRAEAEALCRRTLDTAERLAAEFHHEGLYRQDLGRAQNLLGKLLTDQGKYAESEQAHQRAVTVFDGLAADFPRVPEYRGDLAETWNSQANILVRRGKRSEAKKAYERALAILEDLDKQSPRGAVFYRIVLAGTQVNYGRLLRTGNEPEQALGWQAKAIAGLGAILQQVKVNAVATLFLRNAHLERAESLAALNRHAEAVLDWDKAIELNVDPRLRVLHLRRADCRARAGQVEAATREAEQLTKDASDHLLYDIACVYAVASGKVADKKQEYADRAMELLHKAVKAGYKDAAHMKKDPDLDSLREREDFKKLIAELEKKN